MTRLTKADWKIINAALAYYEADDLSDEAEDEDAYYARIAAVRRKVHERLRGDV